MACDTRLKSGQTIQQRAEEVRRAVAKLDKLLASGVARAKVAPNGAVVFVGWQQEDRDGVTDACGYRRIVTTGSALAKAALQRAEMLAGRSIDRQVVASGHHSHDGGQTWHSHKG